MRSLIPLFSAVTGVVMMGASSVLSHSTQEPWAPAQGTRSVLVVYAKFREETPQDTLAPAYAHEFFDADRPGSFTHFYLAMSRGALHIRGAVVDRVYISEHKAAYYTKPDPNTGLGKFGTFSKEVLSQVAQDPAVDLGQYDNDGPDGVPSSGDDDGYVDFIFLNTLSAPM